MGNNKTAVEWLWVMLLKGEFINDPDELFQKAKEMEKQQQETLAVDFAEWYESSVLAKGDYEMIDKDKKELLETFKKTYGKQ